MSKCIQGRKHRPTHRRTLPVLNHFFFLPPFPDFAAAALPDPEADPDGSCFLLRPWCFGTSSATFKSNALPAHAPRLCTCQIFTVHVDSSWHQTLVHYMGVVHSMPIWSLWMCQVQPLLWTIRSQQENLRKRNNLRSIWSLCMCQVQPRDLRLFLFHN